MADPSREEVETISRQRHLFYVLVFSAAVWVLLFLFIGIFGPYVSHHYMWNKEGQWNEVDLRRTGLYKFIPIGAVVGIIAGFVINRIILVAKLKSPKGNTVSLSIVPRIGHALLEEWGLLYCAFVIGLLIVSTYIMAWWYSSNIFGWFPGLSPGRHVTARWWAMDYFRKNPDPDVIPAMLSVLKKDGDDIMRLCALRYLREHGDEKHAEPIISVLKNDASFLIRGEAAGVLSYFKSLRAVKPLIDSLVNDSAVWVRQQCAESLGYLGDKRAVPYLITAFRSDPHEYVRSDAVQALGGLQDKRAFKPMIRALSIKGGDLWAIIQALGYLGDPRAIPHLSKFLQSVDFKTRLKAIQALGWMRNPEALEKLIDHLENTPNRKDIEFVLTEFDRMPKNFPEFPSRYLPDLKKMPDAERSRHAEKARNWIRKNRNRLSWDKDKWRWYLTEEGNKGTRKQGNKKTRK